MFALQRGLFGEVFFGAAGEVCPLEEDLGSRGAGAALQLGFDGPGEGGLVVFGEQGVGAEGVEVFGVEEEAVHVEEAGFDGWGLEGWHFGGGVVNWFGSWVLLVVILLRDSRFLWIDGGALRFVRLESE